METQPKPGVEALIDPSSISFKNSFGSRADLQSSGSPPRAGAISSQKPISSPINGNDPKIEAPPDARIPTSSTIRSPHRELRALSTRAESSPDKRDSSSRTNWQAELSSPIQPSLPPLDSSAASFHSIPSSIADNTDARSPAPPTPHVSAPYDYPFTTFRQQSASDPIPRHTAIYVEPFSNEKRRGLWRSVDVAHQILDPIGPLIFDTLPRQLYLWFLLRLPYIYFSRVTWIFVKADMTLPQIKKCVLEAGIHDELGNAESPASFQYSKLQNMWRNLIDSLIKEWKTLNIISVLLLSAILTILQIESAANDPVIRYSALLSMVCALMSLFYGCIYIIRFGTMRTLYQAAEWALEAKRSKTGIFWNLWVFLAMPVAWFGWSMILYIVCIMSFVWRTGTTDDADRGLMTREDALPFRIIVTIVLSLGLTYFALIVSVFRRYGLMMEQAWHTRLVGWANEAMVSAPYDVPGGTGHIPIFPIPLADPTASVSIRSQYQPTADPGFPTMDIYPSDRRPESKNTSLPSKPSSSTRSHITRSASDSSLRSSRPHAKLSFSNIVREHGHGTDNEHRGVASQPVARNESRSDDLEIPPLSRVGS